MSNQRDLQEQIKIERQKISADGYPMSIGELVNMYRDGELVINPAYQRLYRWSSTQRSRLIDSLLLGIPIPSVFVAQREDGVWEVIDGLQRISTLLQLFGVLEDHEPLVLSGTKNLPALEGMRWVCPENPDLQFSQAQKLMIKREKLSFKIILKESDPLGKYEIFQRLNTGASQLTHQEIRDCIMVMLDPSFHEWFRSLVQYQPFRNTLRLSNHREKSAFDGDLVARLLAFASATDQEIAGLTDIGEFVTDRVTEFAQDNSFDRAGRAENFKTVFDTLASLTGDESFQRLHDDGTYKGRFLTAPFEAIAIGMFRGLRRGLKLKQPLFLKTALSDLWSDQEFLAEQGAGVPPRRRLETALRVGTRLFFE